MRRGLTLAGIASYFLLGRTSLVAFYASCLVIGIGTGYWAVFVTMASEQFGTNLRATATTTAPNFVRGAVVPLTMSNPSLRCRASIVARLKWCRCPG